jgi:hypothetical protein
MFLEIFSGKRKKGGEDMSVYQLTYFSSASKKMLKSDLYIILRQARKNNELLNITGALIYIDKNFIQILEGEKNSVCNLFEKISEDNRHSNVKILQEKISDHRSFQDWAMAYSSPSARELATWAELNSTTTVEETLNFLKSDSNLVTDTLVNFLERSDLS